MEACRHCDVGYRGDRVRVFGCWSRDRDVLLRRDATVDDHRTVHQFSDAELSAILRNRVGVVPVESDEERPERGALN